MLQQAPIHFRKKKQQKIPFNRQSQKNLNGKMITKTEQLNKMILSKNNLNIFLQIFHLILVELTGVCSLSNSKIEIFRTKVQQQHFIPLLNGNTLHSYCEFKKKTLRHLIITQNRNFLLEKKNNKEEMQTQKYLKPRRLLQQKRFSFAKNKTQKKKQRLI